MLDIKFIRAEPEAVKAGQAAFYKRARLNGLAHAGQYGREMEAA